MLFIVYDRNFRMDDEREKKWKMGDPVPDIAPHRIIEIHADGAEKEHVERILGGTITRRQASFYGDMARTVYLNLGEEYEGQS